MPEQIRHMLYVLNQHSSNVRDIFFALVNLDGLASKNPSVLFHNLFLYMESGRVWLVLQQMERVKVHIFLKTPWLQLLNILLRDNRRWFAKWTNTSRGFTQCKSECLKMREVVSAMGMSKRTLRIIYHAWKCHRMSENGVCQICFLPVKVWSHLLMFDKFVSNFSWNPFYLEGQMIRVGCANLQYLPVKNSLLWKWLFCVLCFIHNYTIENKQWTFLSVKFH